MKVFAVNSSARAGRESKTGILLDALLQGMVNAGAEVELANLREKKIETCIGCFTCMTRTPGVCIHPDDMTRELFPHWLAADLAVMATPLFHYTVNSTLKTFIERTFPICEPYMIVRDNGRFGHPLRATFPDTVLLSVCGFPDMVTFDALKHYAHWLYGDRLVAEIYRPGAEAMERYKKRMDDILAACAEAGAQLVADRAIKPETMARISQPVVDDLESFSQLTNCVWRECIEGHLSLEQYRKSERIPRPDSIPALAGLLAMGFNPDRAGDAAAVIQFEFSGDVCGDLCMRIGEGECLTGMERAENPDLVIRTPFGLWLDIMSGLEDGAKAFMEGRYTADGNADLLLRFKDFFGE